MKCKINQETKKAKKLFDMCYNANQGIHGKLHIVNISKSNIEDEEMKYRIYHADGYCFEIERIKIDLAEDEMCESMIGKHEYLYGDNNYEGFKELTIEKAITLLKTF